MRAAVPMAVIPLAAYYRSRLDRTVGIPPLIFEPRWQAGRLAAQPSLPETVAPMDLAVSRRGNRFDNRAIGVVE